MFKQVTPKFERPEDIVNYEANDEGEKTAQVEVLFEFKDQDYLIQRTHHQQWDSREKTDLLAFKIQNGNSKVLNAPETFTSSVIPPEMAKYFFFDGEAAESFAAARNYKEIEGAIRSILGCSLAETAIADLKDLGKTVEREIGAASGDANIEALEKHISAKTKEIETAVSLRELTLGNITTWKEQLDQIVQGLRKMQGVEEIQKQRDDKEALKIEADNEIKSCQEEIMKWIGQRSIQVVSKRISQVTLDFIDEASLRGRIPSPYNEDFVKGLLKDGICVCHRPLPAGTAEWKAVAELLKTASNAEVLNRVVRARARTQQLREEGSKAPKALTAFQAKLVKHLAQRAKLEQDIAELGKKIEGLPVKEIAERERSRRILEDKIDKEREKIGGVKAHIVSLEKAKKEFEDELDELARNNKRTKAFGKRHLLMRSAALLNGLLEKYESDARGQIESDVNDILETVAHKDYQCRFNENFVLELILNKRARLRAAARTSF